MTTTLTRKYAFLLLLSLAISGCATTANNPKDPWEGFNRNMFQVNEGIDTVFKPLAQGYETVTPQPIRTGINNFFGNINDVWIGTNNFLQGKWQEGFSDIARILVNTGFGIGGLFDVASALEIEKHSEDFGKTLGKWGVGEGPYVFLPILGPRTLRDTFGVAVDLEANLVWWLPQQVSVRNSLVGLQAVQKRANLLPADKIVDEAAIDKYNYIRDAYLSNRRYEIFDGHPPPEKEAEAE